MHRVDSSLKASPLQEDVSPDAGERTGCSQDPFAPYLPPGKTAQLLQDSELRFSRSGEPINIQKMTGFVSHVQFADGKVWVPNRQSLEDTALIKVLPPSPEEQRLSDLYRRKGLAALVDELKKY